MRPSDALWDDHEVLRARLALLEEWVPLVRITPCMLWLLVDLLAKDLRRHTAKEERLTAALASGIDAQSVSRIQHLQDDHDNQRTQLAILHELLEHCGEGSAEAVFVQATHLINDLREHMAKEEQGLFWLIDQECEEEGERVAASGEDHVEQFLHHA